MKTINDILTYYPSAGEDGARLALVFANLPSVALANVADIARLGQEVEQLVLGFASAVNPKRINAGTAIGILFGRPWDPLKDWRNDVRKFVRRWNFPTEVIQALG